MRSIDIAVLPGDGIGLEVTPKCCDLLAELSGNSSGYRFNFQYLEAGATCYQRTGEALPAEVLQASRAADAILLGAMGLPSVRYPDGTEISPQLDLRFEMDLFAGVRPVKPLKGLPLPLANRDDHQIDFVLIRESTEGLFASHGKGQIIDDKIATDTMEITRAVSEKLFRFSFDLARDRAVSGVNASTSTQGRLTCVDKANVFTSMAFFRKIYDEVAGNYQDVGKDYMYVDAAALNMVRHPWELDVLVTENMFGDILSDLGAGLMGGMGMAPSADIGENHAVFQPCHGSAPDIAGQGKANPVAMILSAAMMLDWLGKRHNIEQMVIHGQRLKLAVEQVFSAGTLLPFELGGSAGTSDIFNAVKEMLDSNG